MHGNVTRNGKHATKANGTSAAHETTDGKSAVDDENWFSEGVHCLIPHKPGTVLHLTTGLGDERLCQRYAAGHVKPPAYFFRRLLRTPGGLGWLRVAMSGSEERWWSDVEEGLRLLAFMRAGGWKREGLANAGSNDCDDKCGMDTGIS